MDELVAAADTLKASRARKRPMTSRRTFYEIATRYESTLTERRSADTLEAAMAASKGDRSGLEKARDRIAVLDKHVAQLTPVLEKGENALAERKAARSKAAADLTEITDKAVSGSVSDKRELGKLRQEAAALTAEPAKYAYHVRVAAPNGSTGTAQQSRPAESRSGPQRVPRGPARR